MPGITLSKLAGTADISFAGSQAYNIVNNVPVNTVTQITDTNSNWQASGLPLLIATPSHSEYNAYIRWQIECYGEGPNIVQIATPLTFLNSGKNLGQRFVRTKADGTGWSLWRPLGALLTDVMPTDNALPYYVHNVALNRRNCFDLGAGFGLIYDMPMYPTDGDVVEWVTNGYTTNALRVTTFPFLGATGAFGVNGDTVTLPLRYSTYRTVFDGYYARWRFA